MKRTMKWAVAALILVLLVGGALRALGARKAQQAKLTAGAPAAETVVELSPADVVRVARRELAETLPVSGTLRAVDSAQVKARVAGELIGLAVR